jgi:hypothetical protein
MSDTIQVGTAAERARRRIVDEAIHSGEMEGLSITDAARADVEEFVSGRIDADDLVTRAQARHGLV